MFTILAILALIIAIPFGGALFIKKGYSIEREIVIRQPAARVFDYIRHPKNQDHYSKWVMTDPGMKKEFKGIDGTVGFVYRWDSEDKQAGKGEQEIVNIVKDKILDVQVRFERPFKNTANTPFMVEPLGSGESKVTWSMIGVNPYPRNFINVFIDKMLGKDLEISLLNLKAILEKS